MIAWLRRFTRKWDSVSPGGQPEEQGSLLCGRSSLVLSDTLCPSPTFFGTFLVSALILVAIAHSSEELKIEFRMFRGSFLMILIVFLTIVNINAWRSSGVNYTKLFDLETNDRQASHRLACIASALGMVWGAFVMAGAYTAQLQWTAVFRALPSVLWLTVIGLVVCPLKRFFYETRMWTIGCLWRIVVSPLYRVRFPDFWIADQLNSLTLVLLDFEYTLCFLVKVDLMSDGVSSSSTACMNPATAIRQVISCLPSWWRFAQCLRNYHDTREVAHLLNAGKYFSTFPMVVAAAMLSATQHRHKDWRNHPEFWLWLALAIIHAVYVYVWDIIMDWGLLQRKRHNYLLRPHLLFSHRWVYFTAPVVDLALRFAWAVKMSSTVSSYFGSVYLVTFLAIGEVLRRFLWNFFRLEYEQTKSLPPLSPPATDAYKHHGPFTDTELRDPLLKSVQRTF